MNKLAAAFCLGFVVSGAWSLAQTACAVPAPSVPPTPRSLVIFLPVDGGTAGCTIIANVPGGAPANSYPIGNAKCAQSVAIASQAAANDNGWNDGGVP